MERLKRFEYCDNDLMPWIEKVLLKLNPKKKEEFLEDDFLQVISSYVKREDENGFQLKFRKPVKSIIYINWKELETESKEKKIYGIAHEIGHHFAGSGESRLLEKEANDWLKKWGDFNEIINKVNHSAPINEEKGYRSGYEWASNQDRDELLISYHCFRQLWNDKNLTKIDEYALEINLIDVSKMEKITVLDEHGEKIDNEDINKGVAYGIMKRIRELEKKSSQDVKGKKTKR